MPPIRSNRTERNEIKIKVATINIFNPVGEENKDRREKIKKKLSTINEADVICLQESVRELEITGFTEVYTDGPGPYELVSLFIRNNSIWNAKESIRINTTKCPTNRTNFITTLCLKANPEIKVKIGNVHLCGGSIDEQEDTYENYIKDRVDIDVIKREILIQMIKNKSDIILGDFNSDEQGTNIPFLISTQSWEEDDAEEWNASPSTFLRETGYTRVNDNPFYTSCYGGTPDMIWYNANKVSYGDGTMKMIDMGAKNDEEGCVTDLSDHNGIYAEFTINKDLTSSRYSRSTRRNVTKGGKYKRKTRKYKRKNRKTNKK